ncbi:MAG TPA: hypothetical protein ENK57_00040 [Polyangiaceae bacterium]|nr:hypothetical protein [Polyangiaceae bacterium]
MAVSRSGSPRLIPVVLALGWASTLAVACKPAAPAKHPDHDKVVNAQKAWCDMLGELEGSSWMHQKECEAAYPAASAAFLTRMTTCYGEQMKSYGDDAPDSGAVIADCTLQVLGGVDPGNVSNTVAGRARCARQQRCQAVSPEVCEGVFDRLDGPSKAMLTNVFNLKTQHELASCLADGDCADNPEADEAAVESCYREQRDRLVWLPLSL